MYRSNTQRPRTIRGRQQARMANDQILNLLSTIRTLEDELISEQYRNRLLLEENQQYHVSINDLDVDCKAQKKIINTLEAESQLRKTKNAELQGCEESLRSIYQQLNQLTTAAEKRNSECELLALERDQIKEENQVLIQTNLEARSRLEQFTNQLGPFLGMSQKSQARQLLQVAISRIQSDKQALICLQNQQLHMKKQQSIAIGMQRELIVRFQYEQKLLLQRINDSQKIKQMNNLSKNQKEIQKIIEEMLVKQDQLIEQLTIIKRQEMEIREEQDKKIRYIQRKAEQEAQNDLNKLRQYNFQAERLKTEIQNMEVMIQSKSSICTQVLEEHEFKSKVDLNLQAMKRLRHSQERNKHLKLKLNELHEAKALLLQERALLS